MNEKQKLLLQNLKNIKDYWTAVDDLNSNTDLIWSDYENEYKILQTKLTSKEELSLFRIVCISTTPYLEISGRLKNTNNI